MWLSLPGAAMWSVPVGMWIQYKYAPGWMSGSALIGSHVIPIAFFGLPLVAICSYLALREGVQKTEKSGLTVLLVVANLFNAMTAVFTFLATAIMVVVAVSSTR
jgi:hypothetical protein